MPSTWAALADPHRRAILELLREAPRAVGDLVRITGLTQPGTSKHLRVLRDAGLVSERRAGTRRLYRARPEGLEELVTFLEGFWDERLATLKRQAEHDEATGDAAAG